MKRIIIFLLILCFLIMPFFFTVQAESEEENIGDVIIYDSLNISDSETEKFMASIRTAYRYYVHYLGDDVKASLAIGYDIRVLNDPTGFLKIYYGYDPRNDLILGLSVSEAVEKATDFRYLKDLSNEHFLIVDDKDAVCIKPESNEYSGMDENIYYIVDTHGKYDGYKSFYRYVYDFDSLFSSVEATKLLGDINILQVYAFEIPTEEDYLLPPFLIYFVTDQGDFVLYSHDNYGGSDYLLPLDLFISLTEKMHDREEFYDRGATEAKDRIDVYADLSTYIVGDNKAEAPTFYYKYPFLKNDPGFVGYQSKYHFAKGIGLNKASQLRDTMMQIDPAYEGAFINGGLLKVDQLSWEDFLQTLSDAGCTTYDECRAYIDAAIEERKNPPPVTNTPSGGGDMTQNNPADSGDGKSNAFLFWLIPSVLVVLAAAVAIFILKKKKKA